MPDENCPRNGRNQLPVAIKDFVADTRQRIASMSERDADVFILNLVTQSRDTSGRRSSWHLRNAGQDVEVCFTAWTNLFGLGHEEDDESPNSGRATHRSQEMESWLPGPCHN